MHRALKCRSFLFATHADLIDLFARIEADHPFCYYACGSFETPTVKKFMSVSQIPDVGVSMDGKRPRHLFLIADPEAPLEVRQVSQRRGGVRYLVDNLANPDTAIFVPGGAYEDGKCIIRGDIYGMQDLSDRSRSIYKQCESEIRKLYRRINAYYVGEESYRLFQEGWRLAESHGSSIEYDLSE